MFQRYGILNFFLLLFILLLVFKNYEVWINSPPEKIKKVEGKRGEVKMEAAALSSTSPPTFPPTSLLTISEKNIFHPERKEFALLNPEPPRSPNLARPQIQLQGVMISEEIQSASLIIQGKSLAKGERATKTLKLGDQLGDYKLTRILPDRIVLEAPGDVYEVLLYDLKSPKKRVDVRTTLPAKPATPTPAPSTAREIKPEKDQPSRSPVTPVLPISPFSGERKIPLPPLPPGGEK